MNVMTMLGVNTTWMDEETFKIIPIDKDAPYNEMIYDVNSDTLIILSKEKRTGFHMVERLSPNGYPIPVKGPVKNEETRFQMERVQLETFIEYYITNRQDILKLIEIHCLNAKDGMYSKAFKRADEIKESLKKAESYGESLKKSLVDALTNYVYSDKTTTSTSDRVSTQDITAETDTYEYAGPHKNFKTYTLNDEATAYFNGVPIGNDDPADNA